MRSDGSRSVVGSMRDMDGGGLIAQIACLADWVSVRLGRAIEGGGGVEGELFETVSGTFSGMEDPEDMGEDANIMEGVSRSVSRRRRGETRNGARVG
jgi:hypothetical protein